MASKVGGRETFRVKTLVGRHKCGRVFGNKSASVQWIAQVLVDRFVNVGGMTVNQIIDEIKKSFSVGISPWKAGRAKQIAMDSLVGDGERQYGRLYDYVAELLRVKAGTFKIKVNQPQPTLPPRFGAFYMCLEGCKEGFLGSCRPFIGVDGCHLKTTYGGQLLVAVARDPNDQYFPLAFAVVENECKETWRWFLSLLLGDIGGIDCQRWIFISDQQKGLMVVFGEILNGVEHRLCLRHLYNNYKKKFGGGLLIRDLMMGAAKATYFQDWEKKKGELKTVNCDAYNWFATLREKVINYPGDVMPKPRKRLDREVEKSGNWLPVWAGGAKFEVIHGFTMDKFVVDISNNSCSCYFWDLVGIPCRHAVAAIHYKLENPEDYVHPYYKKHAYNTCYAPQIIPINGQQLWPTSDTAPLLPPTYKTPPGRPKKLRRREADEYVNHSKLSKKNIGMKCSSCNAYGHNVRSCKRGQKSKDTRGTSAMGESISTGRRESARRSASAGRGGSLSTGRGGSASTGRGGSARRTAAATEPSASTSQGQRTSQLRGAAHMRQGGRRTSSRLAAQFLGSQASCN
ncbi:uncharacterized protein LOC128196507 [Vigna angularis]|uniref:uncharacterized protein LOC128196507 n=1 Tax=Phaseolus angularis TaxID=3914 RepID=UPI0022B3CF2C|nr:uncharacterized protein LOC128196507 [Vigna angularis]